MKELEYPFDPEILLLNQEKFKEIILRENRVFVKKNVAILGGETTRDIKLQMELFLLNYGIQPIFYESEYNRFFEEGMFANDRLEHFSPDFIYICTSIRNIYSFPSFEDDKQTVDKKINKIIDTFTRLWDNLSNVYKCPIIQNNFEYPFYRLLGNKDAYDFRGRVNYVTRLNCRFYEYAQTHNDFYICDVNYLSASYGLDKWSDPYYWYLYKYAVAVPAIPYLSYNVVNIIKSLLGMNKKAFNIDLDNTLWGGIVGDDGWENIEIGQETPVAQSYSEFQNYIKQHKQIGILLTVNSKNDEENAIAGFERSDSILKKEDFSSFKANWNPKSQNLLETAAELSLLPESFVFLDDSPIEREDIRTQLLGVVAPNITEVEHYIQTIDKS